jgi:AcrR family transcriptional regulator
MTSNPKRMGREDAPARKELLDATERVLRQQGYAAMNARTIADDAGLKKQLVFYYFHGMDELICETFARCVAQFAGALTKAFASADPLRALWDLHVSGDAGLFMEFTAIANHNDALRTEFLKFSVKNTKTQIEGIERYLKTLGAHSDRISPRMILFIISSLSKNFIVEKELGILDSSDEFEKKIAAFLQTLKP